MIALGYGVAPGSAGLAVVLSLLLLHARGSGVVEWILLGQSALIAIAAAALRRPELAAAPLLMAAAVWSVRQRSVALGVRGPFTGGPRFTVLAGAALIVLSQSQGLLAQPLALVLLGILMAATRPQASMQAMALVSVQNGITLAACRLGHALPLPLACLLLPLPLLAALAIGDPRPAWRFLKRRHARWCGWVRLAASAMLFAATLLVPLDPLAAVFAPLFAFEGLLRAWAERRRVARAPVGHAAALVRMIGVILAVATADPVLSWIGLLAAAAAALWPVLERRWSDAVLAFSTLGIALLGVLALRLGAPPIGFCGLFLGFAILAAIVPDLAAPAAVVLLRLSTTPAWAPPAAWFATAAAIGGLLLCALLLARGSRHRLALLQLAQVSVALLALGLDQPDGRFAALALLILLVLTRSASRFPGAPAALFARAGLGGIPPLGVFPALILVVLAISAHAPWLLLPLGIALVPMVPASLPTRLPAGPKDLLSLAWVPLVLALGFGFFTPDSFAQWLHRLTLGQS